MMEERVAQTVPPASAPEVRDVVFAELKNRTMMQ
jgi:hypothetical protein